MRILYVTTISLTMNSFFKPHIEMLVKEGHQVDIACNDRDLALDALYTELGCKAYCVDYSRNPIALDNVKAYGQLRKIIREGNYDIVHCHTPNASVITRLVCRKFRARKGLKVFYTAHGFHFYKGAPKLNWMIYYPVERFCSRFTDKLITINQEDFALAKSKFHAKEVCYIPGVGVDLNRFHTIRADRAAKRGEMGIPEDAFLLLSVGELNENKNHQVVIKALAEIKKTNLHYAIAGVGNKKTALLELAEQLGIFDRVHLLGYRKDIGEVYSVSDLFCFPSIREGLSVSLMEAMAYGLPVVCSRIRGNTDLVDEKGGIVFDPLSDSQCRMALEEILNADLAAIAEHNRSKVQMFSLEPVLKGMREIYAQRS